MVEQKKQYREQIRLETIVVGFLFLFAIYYFTNILCVNKSMKIQKKVEIEMAAKNTYYTLTEIPIYNESTPKGTVDSLLTLLKTNEGKWTPPMRRSAIDLAYYKLRYYGDLTPTKPLEVILNAKSDSELMALCFINDLNGVNL